MRDVNARSPFFRTVRKHALALQLSDRSILRRTLHRDLKTHPCKIVIVQELTETDLRNACQDLRDFSIANAF